MVVLGPAKLPLRIREGRRWTEVWLHDLLLDRYAQAFAENDIDEAELQTEALPDFDNR